MKSNEVSVLKPRFAESEVTNGKVGSQTRRNYQWDISWINVFFLIYIHLVGLQGLYKFLTFQVSWTTFIWVVVTALGSGLSITMGVHRLWSHRSFKARWPLRLLLMIFNLMAFQNSIHEWVRDHRTHHKYTDTDADPHNAKRGFFFSHIGWLVVKKQPECKLKGVSVDLSDLEQDPIVMFQKKYYVVLMPLFCFVVPALVPYYCWGEDGWLCWSVCSCGRFMTTLHFTWSVNSFAHMYGAKPYDKSISSSQNQWVSMVALGEGWHNYHHVFPWDYKASEFGSYKLNFTTMVIDLAYKVGLVYEKKTVSPELIKIRLKRTGDGTKHSEDWDVWGWNDPNLTEEERSYTFQQ